ncbi:alanine and proline-rich secreted protein Apa [Dietzia sp. B32]|uniref:alanine and proline-rich secreted protein Apa n=1 Tax=Dietzia sp. B32 TaxID=2915130 RepID=UPI0021ADAD69|nr:alanine and proline-rich secreted protein Apa [Dietzia sp. B32]UVE94280.1 alanine and proline-rich secreted protein Apa [Dietzia sp. B32]
MGTDDSPVPEYAADYAPAPDDAPDASHLTPEEKRGPRTVHVALALLAGLLVIAVATNPASVLPRDSTLHGAYHVDRDSGLELQVPVGWRVSGDPDFGTVQMRPVGTGRALDTRILAGPLESGIAAAAVTDDQGAATALAETIQMYVLGVAGTRDEQRTVPVDNEAGTGAAISYVVVPDGSADQDSGGLVYTAVFGSEGRRWWVAYVTTSQQSAPGIRWMDRIVDHVRLAR